MIERVPEARRAAWHKRMAERVEQAYGAASDTVAVQLATRFEAGGEPARAIGYLRRAADTALSRFAYREAVALLQHALTLAARLPPSRSARVTMDVLLPLGAALIATSGYAASDVQSVYERALAIGREVDAPKDLQRALRGLWNVALVRADLERAQELAHELMQRAEFGGREAATPTFDAHAKLGQTFLHLGRLAQAQEHLGTALVMPLDAAARTRETPRVAGYLAWVKWYRGWPDQALSAADQACELAQAAGNPHSCAFALGFAGFVHAFRGEWDRAEGRAHAQAALAAEHGLVYWHDWSGLLHGLVAAVGRRDRAGLAVVRAALDSFTAAGAIVGLTHFRCEYAAACLVHHEVDAARNALAAARALVARSGNAYHEPEIHRLEAQALLIERGAAAIDEATRGFERALDLARDQGAVALQVRTLACFVGAARRLEHPCTVQATQLAQLLSAHGEGRSTADFVQASAALTASY